MTKAYDFFEEPFDIKNFDGVLLDTNVWLFLFNIWQSKNDPGYSRIFDFFLRQDVPLFVCSEIISEYINTSTRSAWKAYLKKHHKQAHEFSFKGEFKKTENFLNFYKITVEQANEDILGNANSIMRNESLPELALRETPELDFNDKLIIQTALDNNLCILTDDKDYRSPLTVNDVWFAGRQ
ncbi:type II toxin-antitoxin system VapC family toxin [Furfurilactobacillus entadae]|uniref:type II toxin-antitoxin system VapC family toxin n=1 Tax=Furfurilactobacillus entadae TaxID=2922307 RepID=UPI0035EDF829